MTDETDQRSSSEPGGASGSDGGGVRERARSGARAFRVNARSLTLWVISITVISAAVAGAYKTLTLPEGERLSAEFWVDLTVSGVARGAIYALIALGYSLVYGILLMINFAHGEVFMAGAYSSFFVAVTFAQNGFLERAYGLPALVVLLAVAMAVSTGIALLLERVAYRPLRNAPRLVPLITAIGASLFLQYTFLGFFGPQARGYPALDVFRGSVDIIGVTVNKMQLLVVGAAVASLILLSLFVSRTKTGKSMRAVAEDKEIAALMGIPVNRVIAVTFAVGGMMAGVAGVLYALTFEFVRFDMGFIPGIKAFTAAVLGGIGSIGGAALGGLILGLLEAVGPLLFLRGIHVPSPSQLQDVIAFTILVLVLIFRPGGILGTGEPEKV